MENYDGVLGFFTNAEEPLNASAVAAGTGIDKKEVDKIMNKLKKEGKIVSPKRCYWEIKK
ncbi:MAG: MarR family transcriptional regulator [Firmicutes bacterium]|nr:MarR family transcriptional regulator [Bacillota bacterium]